ncbi:Menaquinone via futalosine step 3 [Vulgatibacter incomptus]|uniref:Multifunctional fusion protein n=1 Tax=Vulgatibacter incomptus TaxID=1391653 RepID=A0A0K1P8H5_9BACT|nr:Menaquinone via futalosine step 3 [Vulgatibacter incomptus]
MNSRPLLYGLGRGPARERIQIEHAPPSECARRLAEGEVDVGLLPVAAIAQLGLYALPVGCVSAKGRVESILLVGETPIDTWHTVSLDRSSRSSATLARLLLAARGKTDLRYEVRDPYEAAETVGIGRGALLIGDAALELQGRFPYRYDLGEMWNAWTGFPLVTALWAVREPTVDPVILADLQEAVEAGKGAFDQLALAHAVEMGEADPEPYRRYLSESLAFDLGRRERAGLAEYLRRANAAGLLPPEIHFASPMPNRALQRAGIEAILSRAAAGKRISIAESARLLDEAPLAELGAAADERRRQLHPDGHVTYIVERNVNYTNVCTTACRFCAFFRAPGKDGGYTLSWDEIGAKLEALKAAGGVQVLLQGGINPELRLPYYEELVRFIKGHGLRLNGFSPEEIHCLAELEGTSVEAILVRLKDAGLDSVPGGGAEVLVDRVRSRIARKKATSAEWLEVMRIAHRLGMRASATLMYGVGETSFERALHLSKLRDLQDETGGFTAFICWPYQDGGLKLRGDQEGAGEYLRMLAVSRLTLDNFENLQASWPTMGPTVGQAALHFGANDFGQVMFEENVVSAAGSVFSMNSAGIERHIRDAGFVPVRRNGLYGRLEDAA